MLDYKYLTHIELGNIQWLLSFIGTLSERKAFQQNFLATGSVETIPFDDTDNCHLLFTRWVEWHTDYDAISTLLVLQSDKHIIQSYDTTKDNFRVLKKGDIVRLNIGKPHNLISDSRNPDYFIALVYESNKMNACQATTFFKYQLSRLKQDSGIRKRVDNWQKHLKTHHSFYYQEGLI